MSARRSGRDLLVRAGIDVGVYPQSDPRSPPDGGREGKCRQFLGTFDVDLADVLRQCEAQFLSGLTDAGVNDGAEPRTRGSMLFRAP